MFSSFIINVFVQGEQPETSKSGLRFISGIICKSKALTFERMLFRATRGNMFFNQAPAGEHVADPVSGELVCELLFLFSLSKPCCFFMYVGNISSP